MNNANKKIVLISDYFNLYLITLFIIFIKPKIFSDYKYWKDISKLNNKQRLELFDIDILKKNLKLKKEKGSGKDD